MFINIVPFCKCLLYWKKKKKFRPFSSSFFTLRTLISLQAIYFFFFFFSIAKKHQSILKSCMYIINHNKYNIMQSCRTSIQPTGLHQEFTRRIFILLCRIPSSPYTLQTTTILQDPCKTFKRSMVSVGITDVEKKCETVKYVYVDLSALWVCIPVEKKKKPCTSTQPCFFYCQLNYNRHN